jgi:DNA adenine methylase
MRLLRYPGGKVGIADWINAQIPNDSHVYCEPFGGGAGVLLNRPRRPVEVYNDLDGGLACLFWSLRHEALAAELMERIASTPYSRGEFARACLILEDARSTDTIRNVVEVGWALFVVMNQSVMGGTKRTPGQWSRSKVDNQPIDTWHTLVDQLPAIIDRVEDLYVEQLPAVKCITKWDSPDTLFYVDPPYLAELRKEKNIYHIEFNDLDSHAELVDCLLRVEGMVALSGYDHDIYQPLLDDGWEARHLNVTTPMTPSSQSINTEETRTLSSRTETLWLNPQAADRTPTPTLF